VALTAIRTALTLGLVTALAACADQGAVQSTAGDDTPVEGRMTLAPDEELEATLPAIEVPTTQGAMGDAAGSDESIRVQDEELEAVLQADPSALPPSRSAPASEM
jgi:hypothetical protein